MRALQLAFARELAEPSAVYRVVDTTLVPAIVRVRAGEASKGLFAGQASFGRSASKTEWVYGFKVAPVVDPEGVVSAFFPTGRLVARPMTALADLTLYTAWDAGDITQMDYRWSTFV
jgi:hypothetical protein